MKKNKISDIKQEVKRLLSFVLIICIILISMVLITVAEIKIEASESDMSIENSVLMNELADGICTFLQISEMSLVRPEDGSEIHPYATGTAQYINTIHRAWVSIAGVANGEGMMVQLIHVNDVTKSDELAKKCSEWEYYQEYPQETYQYHDGEYIIFVVIPTGYSELGYTFDAAKEYFDKSYDTAMEKIVMVNKTMEMPIIKETSILFEKVCERIDLWMDESLNK